MGKRSDFERNPRDFYPTPYEAVVPLLKHLPKVCSFIEPCAGDGRLIDHLTRHGHTCAAAYDIQPMRHDIQKEDVLFMGGLLPFPKSDFIITNPPWERGVLHAMIEKFHLQSDTWLLFDADWMHTVQGSPFEYICKKIISVGRVKWIVDSKSSGMDNCAWYLFGRGKEGSTEFIFR